MDAGGCGSAERLRHDRLNGVLADGPDKAAGHCEVLRAIDSIEETHVIACVGRIGERVAGDRERLRDRGVEENRDRWINRAGVSISASSRWRLALFGIDVASAFGYISTARSKAFRCSL